MKKLAKLIADRAAARLLKESSLREVIDRHVRPRLASAGARKRWRPDVRLADSHRKAALIHKALRRMAANGKTILVGPWLGEVGFEVLYWIPFLKWVQNRFEIPGDRLTILSRGGAAPWYRHITRRYSDIFDILTPEEFRVRNIERTRGAGLKQGKVLSDLETVLLASVKEKMGLQDCEVLQPSMMYRLFGGFYKEVAPMSIVEKHQVIQNFVEIPERILSDLPKDYVAVKFYFSPNFPDTPGNRAFAREVIVRLAEQGHVVLLNTGLRMDDHWEFDGTISERVHMVQQHMKASNNLTVQSEILSHAKAFIGTYGGLSYVAAFYGVDTLAFYSDPTPFNPNHLDLARNTFQKLNRAVLTALDTHELDSLDDVIGCAWGVPKNGNGTNGWPQKLGSRALDYVLARPVVQNFLARHLQPDPVETPSAAEALRAPVTERNLAEEHTEKILRSLKKIARGEEPILVGPWLSEVGFELLYWVPFLQWFKAEYGIPAERFIVASRGGAKPFYGNVTPNYFEVFDHWALDQYRKKNEERVAQQGGGLKQVIVSDFDREIIEKVKAQFGVSELHLLHPLFMYKLFSSYWKRRLPIGLVWQHTRYRALPSIEANPELRGLPENFVAARFYFSPPFPDNAENRRFIAWTLGRLSERTDVVLLNTDFRVDDHWDVDSPSKKRIHSVTRLMTPSNNLTIQAQVLARAKAFVGTYGGLSYLAPFCGVDSLAFYSDASLYNVQHVEVSERVFPALKLGRWRYLHTRGVEWIDRALGASSAPAFLAGVST